MAVAAPALAYEYRLSSTAIREAYFLGSSTNGTERELLAEYTHTLPEFKVYVSSVTIETPYLQVAERARTAYNYTAQDAVQEFLAKPPSLFRMRVLVCRGHAELRPLKVTVVQGGTELVPSSIQHSAHHSSSGRIGRTPVIGERVELEFPANKIESSLLTVEIDTSDRQHAETTFDLAKLK